MSSQTSSLESLRETLLAPSGGVVGLVDDLLLCASHHSLELSWDAGHCRVRYPGSNSSDILLSVPLKRSVFRAMLARVAALCNEEHGADSVSPYAGRSHLKVATCPAQSVEVQFVNRADDQSLVLLSSNPGR